MFQSCNVNFNYKLLDNSNLFIFLFNFFVGSSDIANIIPKITQGV